MFGDDFFGVCFTKHFPSFDVCIYEGSAKLNLAHEFMITSKLPPIVEDLRNHAPQQLAELRMLLARNAPARPDPRRPGFYEVEGQDSVFYIFKYPTGAKVLLLGIWERDAVAELAAMASAAA